MPELNLDWVQDQYGTRLPLVMNSFDDKGMLHLYTQYGRGQRSDGQVKIGEDLHLAPCYPADAPYRTYLLQAKVLYVQEMENLQVYYRCTLATFTGVRLLDAANRVHRVLCEHRNDSPESHAGIFRCTAHLEDPRDLNLDGQVFLYYGDEALRCRTRNRSFAAVQGRQGLNVEATIELQVEERQLRPRDLPLKPKREYLPEDDVNLDAELGGP